MSSNGRPPYQLRPLPRATDQIKVLSEKAIQEGAKKLFVDALKKLSTALETEPKESGDPERSLKKPGGTLFHAVFGPLFVQYAVYEHERTVLILKVLPMPGSALDKP